MQFVRKQFLLFLLIIAVYAAYFVTHFHTKSEQIVLGEAANLALFTQPTDGTAPILSAINSATSNIDVEVYLLSDKDIIAGLESACERGVTVDVMLEEHPFGGGNINAQTYQQLQQSCVHVAWTNPTFALTHEKTIGIDNREVFILNQNLTKAAFTSNREYDILDANQQDVSEIQTIFAADWERKSPALSGDNLIVSPVNSRDKLFSLLSSASKSIAIETEVIDDSDIIHLLEAKAEKIPVELVVPTIAQVASNKKAIQELQNAGVKVETIKSPYIHAKLLIVDSTRAYVGSVNLTTQSMDDNREVGIIISQPDIVGSLISDFLKDEESGVAF